VSIFLSSGVNFQIIIVSSVLVFVQDVLCLFRVADIVSDVLDVFVDAANTLILFFFLLILLLIMAPQPFVGPWPFFSVLILHTVGRTPWMGGQP
jgi:hypothetical protein